MQNNKSSLTHGFGLISPTQLKCLKRVEYFLKSVHKKDIECAEKRNKVNKFRGLYVLKCDLDNLLN